MNYYHITADIEDALSLAGGGQEEAKEEEEDPNWLIIPQPAVFDQSSPRNGLNGHNSPQVPSEVKVKRRNPSHRHLTHRFSARLSQLLWPPPEDDEHEPQVQQAAEAASEVKTVKEPEASSHTAKRITEIFESFDIDQMPAASRPSEAVVADGHHQANVVKVRRRGHQGASRRLQRRTNTVSGYFNDWAKWLTSQEPADPLRLLVFAFLVH